MARRAPEKPTGYSGTVLALATAAALAVGIVIGLQLSVLQATPQAQQSFTPAAAQTQVSEADKAAVRIPGLKAEAEANPASAPAWVSLGNAYFDANMPEPAVHAYQHALDLGPGSADVWTDLGVMLRALGRFQEAVAAFDKAREIDPKHRNARFNKGVVLFHDLNDRAGAIAAWKEVLAIDPTATTPDGVPIRDMVQELEKGN